MTNEQRYKTPEERYDEFYKYCKSTSCYDCHLRPLGQEPRMNGNAYCALKWLNSEAEEEEPLCCPFCGGKADVTLLGGHEFSVRCYECLAETDTYETRDDAIAAWNRRAK